MPSVKQAVYLLNVFLYFVKMLAAMNALPEH
jgi:hypothetical protein